VVWLSVNANPFYPQVSAVKAWTDQHGLAGQANWRFGTSTPTVLQRIWNDYGIVVEQDTQARTVNHSTEMFFIDPGGHERSVAQFGTPAANTALFAHGIAQMADDLLPADRRVKVAGPETPSPTSHNATVSATAPDFSLPYLQGGSGTFHLGGLHGKYAVVNFWSSTCTVCRVELPHIEAAYRDTGSQIAFVGVDVSDATGPAKAMAIKTGLTYPLVSDRDGVAAGGEQITGLPFTLILNPKGQIMVRHPGNFTTEQLEYILENYDSALPDDN
jgi:thiol-disulfide isomerase/thioredoxin